MELVFELGAEVVIARIEGHNILFSNSQTNFQQFVPVENLKLSTEGILKEHPDLKGLPKGEMRQEAIKRLKEHIGNLGGENEVMDYIVEELKKCGYSLKVIKKKGFRPVKVK